MLKKPKISVIVAVYNTEKYVERAIESILNQDYPNLELILVEDCSKDNSKKVLRKYKNNERVILIENAKNMGLSYSRNIGLKHASGEYIGYIDSDDYIDPNYYSSLMKQLEKEKAELCVCDMKIVYEDENNRQTITRGYNEDEGKVTKESIINSGLAASACNKLFKRHLLEKYPFAEGKINEDIAVVIPAIVRAKKVAYVSDVFYYYVQRNTSIQNSGFSEKRFDIFAGVETTLERIKGCKEEKRIRDAIIYNQLIVLLIYVIPKEKNLKKRRQFIKRFYELGKNYHMSANPNYWKFLEQQGKKHQIYYRLLLKFTFLNMITCSNLLILCYDVASKLLKKSVVKQATLEDVIRASEHQALMKESKVSISVVIPNYNYEKFLYQRLYSILNQTVKIKEVLILDDCSSDNSRVLIDEICQKIEKNINVKKIYNEKNSGSAFKQWKKGMDLATGDYVWIAEADDYCDKNLLKYLICPIEKDENVVISYSDTAFIHADGTYMMKSVKPEIDILKTGHWNHSFVNDGKEEYHDYSYLNCTIANVSSALLKRGNYDSILKECGKYRQAGDWLFYVWLMRKGKIAYTNKALNFYRVHGNNVSSTTKRNTYIDEVESIYNFYKENYGMSKEQQKHCNDRINLLCNVWNVKRKK